jgi:hypothetical protein
MKLENSVTIYATEEAKKKKKKPQQKQKTKCQSCEIKNINKDYIIDKDKYLDIINEDILKGD